MMAMLQVFSFAAELLIWLVSISVLARLCRSVNVTSCYLRRDICSYLTADSSLLSFCTVQGRTVFPAMCMNWGYYSTPFHFFFSNYLNISRINQLPRYRCTDYKAHWRNLIVILGYIKKTDLIWFTLILIFRVIANIFSVALAIS